MVRVFTNGMEDKGSIPSQVIPKTQKMVLDASLTRNVIWYGSKLSRAIQGKE